MEDYETTQATWNFDGAEAYLIFKIKASIYDALNSWDLALAYKQVRLLRMELDARLDRGNKKKVIEEFEKELRESREKIKGKKEEKKLTEKEEVDGMLKELDDLYSGYVKTKDDELKSLVYQTIEKFYMHLCYIMKKHGMYFRDGEDMRLAILRR